MRNQRDTIAQMLIDHPELAQRKNRYILASRISGIEPEICKLIASILDEYRHQTVADSVGEALAKDLAEYHSDAYHNFKEPGPAWYRKLVTERPQRRINKRELQKFMLDPDYEPMCIDMMYLEYWT